MAIVSFDEMEYQSGEAVVWKVEVEGKVAKIWFKLDDGRIIRETYRTGYTNEKKRLKEVAEVFFGDNVSGRVELDKMVGQACYVELEERPWGTNTWTGVRAVFPVEYEPEYEGESECSEGDDYEPEYEPDYRYESDYEQPLQKSDSSSSVATRPRKIAKKSNTVTEPATANSSSEESSVQSARKAPRPAGGIGGSSKQLPYTIGVSGRPKMVDELPEEDDKD